MPEHFQVDEVMTESGDRLALSLGFVSPNDPLDTLHFVAGNNPERKTPLYVERTDQSLSCIGQVIRFACEGGGLTLSLTEQGARSLGLKPMVRFGFDAHPELLVVAARQLAAIGRAGYSDVVEV
ncbi:hypothetical protein [Chelativorans salis]|uniref:Uncharacterized protein n=1 Tax=Chelativorans salis TaxID=2978478 RepID=A0ABT2LST3_9HYPH|nr:hypothetical protein [Chelativorans sp. EGI FJ00035]MCT7376902.1 hypothetical protein [Chelativorans sp. EGI FJ00035]